MMLEVISADNETVNVIANTTLVVIKDAEIKELNPGRHYTLYNYCYC